MKCQQLILFGVLFNFVWQNKIQAKINEETTLIEGVFLCKICGADNSVLNLIINDKVSDQAQSVSNITIGSKNILVQELVNPLGIRFKVFLTKKADCAKITGWYTGGSWFEGYGWKICQCPTCKSHMGWMFEEIDKIVNTNPLFPSEKGFYGIVLDAVITESYADSLLMLDKVLRN